MTFVRLIARPLLAASFVSGGVNAVKNPEVLASRSRPVVDRVLPVVNGVLASTPVTLDAKRLVQVNGAVHIAAGSMLATGRSPRLASLVLAATVVPTTLGGHPFWQESDPQTRATQRIQFMKNLSLMGGLLIASVDTAGRPSVAWLAKRGARQAKKRARDLTPN